MSFISVEPQSRVLLETHSNSLLAQLDSQLQIIADRYLAFFQERRNIEATYIESLRKLHGKAKIVDASFDSRIEPTPTKAAWSNVRDSLEGMARTQQAFVDVLDNDVIKPLITLKKSKDETREQIEEDLKKSAAQYADHAENEIPKLQQAYLKKYHPQQYAHSTDVPNKRFRDRVSALFRGREEPEPAKVKRLEVSDDDCRLAVARLNNFRSMRAEYLEGGYDRLEELVSTPTVKDVLVKYMDGMTTACAKCGDLATSTRAEVEKALAGMDTSNLTASFRRSLSLSIPPPTFLRSYGLGYSNPIFGVPLVDVETNEDNVPKVMRMCIEEIEKRGPSRNANGIYTLRRRFEREGPFSFRSNNIDFIAALLMRYLWDLPEPLFTLSLEDYRNYRQNRGNYTENGFSLLRLKIHELHPVQRASLGALMRHLLRVASNPDMRAMTMEALASEFSYAVLRGNEVLQDGIHKLVMEDLIRNAHTLFDERTPPPESPPVPSPHVAETASTHTYASSFLSPRLPRSAEVQAKGATTRHRPGLVGGTPASAQSSFSSMLSESDAAMESRLTPSPTALLSPLLGFPSSQTLTEGVEMTTQGQVIPEARGTKAVETLPDSTPPEVVSAAPTSVAEWRLHQLRLSPHPEPLTIPQSPPESVFSGTSEFPLSSATSLQTALPSMRPFSP
ncbi:hypothetical protein BJY52DRAFT_1216594 [Lactarius psammicola]|nr:hypothetical protein BJY52DRAFT_1216594 [Lactarius psammicola]